MLQSWLSQEQRQPMMYHKLPLEDDHSTAAGAAAAAQAAIAEEQIVIGPVFPTDIKEASRVARTSNRPVASTNFATTAGGRNLSSLVSC